MPWISTAVSVGGSLLGGIMGSKSARKAAEQAAIAKREAMALNQGVYNESRANQKPYQEAGQTGLAALLQQSQDNAQGPSARQVMSDPGYQFGLQQGQNAVEGSAAARGGLYSGQNLKDLTQFGTDYATTKYDQAYNRSRTDRNDATTRYGALAGYGVQANAATQNAGDAFAQRGNAAILGNGAAQGNAAIASGNAWQNALNGATSALGNGLPGLMKKSSVNMGIGQNEMDNYGGKYADGGVVRPEPKVGTRSPLPQGATGGGLANAALLDSAERDRQAAATTKAEADAKARPTLPVPARLDRRATLKKQMEDAGLADGGRVSGPGGPRSDDVPIMASNGEHVIDVATVKALGGGDLQRGHNLLTRLRMQSKGGR